MALLARMQDQQDDVQPRGFAASALDEPDREPFLGAVREAGLNPDVPFPKDTALVRSVAFG